MDYYRFSIAWSRVLPAGDVTNVNEKGIEYYNNVIDKLLENNIQPMVTMYHGDLPQRIQLLGGFTNSIIVDYFTDYATLLFERFGDRVKYWVTFNEIDIVCHGYAIDTEAPATNLHGIGDYLCGHNILKAHATVYHLYKQRFSHRNGQLGICLNSKFYYSESNDTDAVDRAMQFNVSLKSTLIFADITLELESHMEFLVF